MATNHTGEIVITITVNPHSGALNCSSPVPPPVTLQLVQQAVTALLVQAVKFQLQNESRIRLAPGSALDGLKPPPDLER